MSDAWNATARARLGYAVDNLLFYGTGGYAGAGVTADIKDAGTNALLVQSTSRSGWTAVMADAVIPSSLK